MDLDADEIRPTPVNTTILRLVQIPRPIPPFSYNRRRGPYERTIYRVTARLREVLPETDGDVHLILADTGSVPATLVAEIPDSACAVGSQFAARYAAARRDLRTAGPGALVEIEGVGFFDYRHGQRGMAENGFELHPVVSLRVVGGAIADTSRGVPGDSARDAPTGPGDVTVWVNSASRVYHCRGTPWYGRTKQGRFTTQREAQVAGARPAYGRRCP